MKPEQQKALFENTARAMGDAPKEVKVSVVNQQNGTLLKPETLGPVRWYWQAL
jgi:hypothetical protein